MYNKAQYLEKFANSSIYKKLSVEYTQLLSDYEDIKLDNLIGLDSHRSDIERNSIFLYSMFYYLEFLLVNNPKVIADVGCGRNFLKKYIPGIVGFDRTPEADKQEWFDQQFVNNNLEKFDSAIAINSIHYISLINFVSQINKFGKIIKPGGRGYVTFNLQKMLENTKPHEYYQLFDLTKELTMLDYRYFIEVELKKIKYNIITVDITFDLILQKKYDLLKGAEWPRLEQYLTNDMTGVPEHIINEINRYNIIGNPDGYNDPFNGNIRIVFEV